MLQVVHGSFTSPLCFENIHDLFFCPEPPLIGWPGGSDLVIRYVMANPDSRSIHRRANELNSGGFQSRLNVEQSLWNDRTNVTTVAVAIARVIIGMSLVAERESRRIGAKGPAAAPDLMRHLCNSHRSSNRRRPTNLLHATAKSELDVQERLDPAQAWLRTTSSRRPITCASSTWGLVGARPDHHHSRRMNTTPAASGHFAQGVLLSRTICDQLTAGGLQPLDRPPDETFDASLSALCPSRRMAARQRCSCSLVSKSDTTRRIP